MKSYTTHWYTPPFDDCCVSHMSWMVCKYNTNTIHAPKLHTALSKPPTDREIKTTAGEGFQLKVCFHASRLFLEQNLQSGTHRALFVLWENISTAGCSIQKAGFVGLQIYPQWIFSMHQDLCAWSQDICDRALGTHCMSLPPYLPVEIYCATRLDFNNCNTLCSAMLF